MWVMDRLAGRCELVESPNTLLCKSHCQGQKITSPGAQPGCVHLPGGFAGCEIKSASHLQWHPGLGKSPARRLAFLQPFGTPRDPRGLYRCRAGMTPSATVARWDPRAFPACGKGGPPHGACGGDGPSVRLAVHWGSPPLGRHGTPPCLPLFPDPLGSLPLPGEGDIWVGWVAKATASLSPGPHWPLVMAGWRWWPSPAKM